MDDGEPGRTADIQLGTRHSFESDILLLFVLEEQDGNSKADLTRFFKER